MVPRLAYTTKLTSLHDYTICYQNLSRYGAGSPRHPLVQASARKPCGLERHAGI